MRLSRAGYTTATLAEHFRAAGHTEAREWMIRRLFERGLLPEPARLGRYRVIPESDVADVERAMRAAGYLRDQRPEVAAC